MGPNATVDYPEDYESDNDASEDDKESEGN